MFKVFSQKHEHLTVRYVLQAVLTGASHLMGGRAVGVQCALQRHGKENSCKSVRRVVSSNRFRLIVLPFTYIPMDSLILVIFLRNSKIHL